jgi:hypothetical protein
MKMFLDDERMPVGDDWVIVRSVPEAIACVEKNGIPNFISFDHDLEHRLTGYDFAKWLVERDLDIGDMPADFTFYVHSQNPVGKANIEGLLNQYLAFKRR